jgi:hypothetical protein
MIIRSNQISRSDVIEAARAAGVNFIDTNAGYSRGYFEPIREFTPKAYQYGYEVFLTGSSPYAAARQSLQGYGETAATWDEWGLFIEHLFEIDPAARIGEYKGRENFRQVTRAERDRIRQWHTPNSYQARTHRAPWLDPVQRYWEAGVV